MNRISKKNIKFEVAAKSPFSLRTEILFCMRELFYLLLCLQNNLDRSDTLITLKLFIYEENMKIGLSSSTFGSGFDLNISRI